MKKSFFCSRTLAVIILASIMLIPASLVAQSGGAVIPIERREKSLAEGKLFISQKDPDLKATFSELRYPFAFKEKEVIPEAVEEVEVVEEPKEPELTDRQVLDEIAPKINASGTLVRGSKAYLIFPNGQLPDGGTIRLNFRDKTYIIQVTDVTTSGYSLRLNDEVAKKTFGTEMKGTIERNSPEPNQ